MLRVEQLSYHSGDKLLLSIDHLELNTGDTLAVLGPNGAGKSTFLKAICGDINSEGSISLYGRDIRDWPANLLARHLGVLPQSSQLTFPFKAVEVVELGLIPLKLSRPQAKAKIDKVMALCDCAHLKQSAFPTLSGGEKQRVQLARVLLQLSQADQSPLLLLDEPTSAQDLGHQHLMLSLMNRLAQEGYGIISILHDLNHCLHYCQRCLVLEQGQVCCQGQPQDVLVANRIHQVWHYRPAFGQLEDQRPVMA